MTDNEKEQPITLFLAISGFATCTHVRPQVV